MAEALSSRLIGTVRLLWRNPGTAGLLFTLLSVPIILIAGLAGTTARVIVAIVAMSLYPVVDVPRINGYPSWLLGALSSVVVWMVAFAVLGGAGGALQLREGSLVFLGSFVLYPLALAISAFVRLEAWLSQRPLEAGPRNTAIVVVIGYALLVAWWMSQ